jgi:hypothetical protein
MQQDMATIFERFVERKWQDALNVAAVEPASWRGDGEKANPSVGSLDRTAATGKGTLRITGAVNVVEQKAPSRSHSPSWDVSFGRRCRARNLIGCDGDHVMLQCDKLMSLGLGQRREVLERSGLCMFCLKHAAELECYGRGGLSKPRCTQAGCDGEHTPGVHKLMGEESVGVNLVAEDESELEEDEDEDEEWWVGTIGVEGMRDQEEEALDEASESEPEGVAHLAAMQSDSGLEEEPECLPDNCSAGEMVEDGWWSPEPPQPYSEEDGEGGVYYVQVRDPKSQGNQPLHSTATGSRGKEAIAPDKLWEGQSPCPRGAKRRKLRKRPEKTRDQEWEEARQDAWLRQMLSDTSSGEDEESCGRFAESGRWISELFKISQYSATTSGGECSGQKMPDYS